MSSRDLTLSVKLFADATRFVNGLVNGERGVRRFTGVARREFNELRNITNSVEGRLAQIGVAVSTTALIMQSAGLDKSLSQIGQTAGASQAEVRGLRTELFDMAQDTGQKLDDLKLGFNNAVQSGLEWNSAIPVIDATSKAVAVTGAAADALTSSLTVAGTAFNFDLAKPRMALTLLDQMTVAGRLGNAELENLASIIGRIGPNAAGAGFGFQQTLAFVEGLSMIERQPERLATLADSTLRLFTNLKYMRDAQKSTGVKFFDAEGNRRDGLAILEDLKKQYDLLNTEQQRAVFIQRAFGNADLDTQRGMRVLLAGDMLTRINTFTSRITDASGTLERDLPQAINNAVDQTGRLKASLREAADDFAKPINGAIAGAIKWTMDSRENGGLGMDGQDMLLAGVGGTAATLLTARYGAKGIKALAGKFGNVGAGVATGKALEAAVGVTPVYVVNMPGTGIGGGAPTPPGVPAAKTAAGGLGMMGTLGVYSIPMIAAGVGAFATDKFLDAERAKGSVLAKGIDQERARMFAPFQDRLNSELKSKPAEAKVDLNIKVDQEGRVVGTSVKSTSPGFNLNVANGLYMVND